MTALSKRKPTTPDRARSDDDNLATIAHLPSARHGVLTGMVGSRMFGSETRPSLEASVDVMVEETKAVLGGDLSTLQKTLVGQAATLDVTFTELARRSFANLGEYNDAAERYMRLALKAQAGCRATIETIHKLQRPHEQVVKHVHVSDGAQAIVADQFHHHAHGANPDGPTASQPQAIDGSSPACSSALRREGANEGRSTMSGARRQG